MNDIDFHNTGPIEITISSWWFFELSDPTQYTSEIFVSFTHSAFPKNYVIYLVLVLKMFMLEVKKRETKLRYVVDKNGHIDILVLQ